MNGGQVCGIIIGCLIYLLSLWWVWHDNSGRPRH